MKLFSKLRNSFRKLTRFTAVAALVAGLIAIPLVKVNAEFYPDRPVFNWNVPAERVGSTTGPVFNSFINTPGYGDERAFFDASRSEDTAAGSFRNVQNNVSQGTKEYVLRMYIHNNANQSTNGSAFDGPGVALNTRVRVLLPTATDTSLRARAYISASNAAQVEDTVDFTDAGQFSMEYVAGSARLYNNGPFSGGTVLPDTIVGGSGALIGYNALDGKLPGCFEYESVVQIRVRVKPVVNQLTINKQVRKEGTTTWAKEVAAKPGETVEWLITSNNTGTTTLNNINVRDVLPPNVKLVSGSIRWIDAFQNAPQADGPLFSGGFNVGNYGPNGGFHMTFKTTVLDNFTECQVRNRNLSYVKSTQTPTENTSSADVIITKDNCQVTPATTPPTPTRLPNTGSGSVAAMFLAATVAGTLGHRFVLSRKNR